MSTSNKTIDDTEPKTAHGASIFGFCDIFSLNFSHELDMKNHFKNSVLNLVDLVWIKFDKAFIYYFIDFNLFITMKEYYLLYFF